ncbi:hypothetical protein BDK51DRAFT_9492, partial [Blyttiomyces helicus]
VCRCAGISDISASIFGSTNPMNVARATIEALKNQRRPEMLARHRGKKAVDVEAMYYGG